MKTALAGDFGDLREWPASPPTAPANDSAGAGGEATLPDVPGRYGEGRRFSYPCVAAILIAHIALLWALVQFDVIRIAPKPRGPTVVELIPDPIAPPPAPPEQPQPKVETPKPQIVAPPPIVAVPVASPPPVAVSATPPPQPDPVSVQAPAPSSAPAVAATVVPPSPLGNKAGNAPPDYPMEARRQKWSGTVRLRVVIGTDGRVKEISVAQSSGHEVLDRAALKAVARWKFQPATRNGEVIEGIGYVPIPFKLKD